MNLTFRHWTGLVTLVAAVVARAETPLDEARSTLDKWVETRQLISKTKSDWQSDKEMLDQSVQLLQRELKSVEEQMTKLGTNSTQVEKERVLAEASLKSSTESLERVKQFASDFEGQVTGLVPRLPGPLQDILKPLLARMPTHSVSTKMPAPERMTVLVGILNELDKFNNAVYLQREAQECQGRGGRGGGRLCRLGSRLLCQ